MVGLWRWHRQQSHRPASGQRQLAQSHQVQPNRHQRGRPRPETSVKFFYQWAQPNTTNATVSFYIDDDLNPLNTNQKLLKQMSAPGNGASSVSYATISLTLDATNATPGYHALYASIGRRQDPLSVCARTGPGPFHPATADTGHHEVERVAVPHRGERPGRPNHRASKLDRSSDLAALGNEHPRGQSLALHQQPAQ